jgi:hypothetical protein
MVAELCGAGLNRLPTVSPAAQRLSARRFPPQVQDGGRSVLIYYGWVRRPILLGTKRDFCATCGVPSEALRSPVVTLAEPKVD